VRPSRDCGRDRRDGLLARVGVLKAGRLLHDLAYWPEGDGLAIWKATATQHRGGDSKSRDQLLCESRFARTGCSQDSKEMAPSLCYGAPKSLFKEKTLPAASHEG